MGLAIVIEVLLMAPQNCSCDRTSFGGRTHALGFPLHVWGSVSNVDRDGTNTLEIKPLGVAISTFETLPPVRGTPLVVLRCPGPRAVDDGGVPSLLRNATGAVSFCREGPEARAIQVPRNAGVPGTGVSTRRPGHHPASDALSL